MRIGGHVPTKGGIDKAIDHGLDAVETLDEDQIRH